MKVGDLVTLATHGALAMPEGDRPIGIVTCIDPEEIRDMNEVEVLWTYKWKDASNHSVWNLEVVNAGR